MLFSVCIWFLCQFLIFWNWANASKKKRSPGSATTRRQPLQWSGERWGNCGERDPKNLRGGTTVLCTIRNRRSPPTSPRAAAYTPPKTRADAAGRLGFAFRPWTQLISLITAKTNALKGQRKGTRLADSEDLKWSGQLKNYSLISTISSNTNQIYDKQNITPQNDCYFWFKILINHTLFNLMEFGFDQIAVFWWMPTPDFFWHRWHLDAREERRPSWRRNNSSLAGSWQVESRVFTSSETRR